MLVKLKRQLQPYIPWLKKGAVILVIYLFLFSAFKIYNVSRRFGITPGVLWHLITSNPTDLKYSQNRTNIVLLGISGSGHEGEDMTDTIMVISMDLNKQDIVLISIPRDTWIPTLKDKINAAYHLGNEKSASGGLILAKSAVEEVIGLPIHYAVLVDFAGFKSMTDVVGGIDVQVKQSFVDEKFPIEGKENDLCDGDLEYKCRYETVAFEVGSEHMDGERALKYVRSRHAEGDAGTDFSRNQRQQAVLIAFKNKITAPTVLTDVNTMKQLIEIAGQAISTDLNLGEATILARFLPQITDQIRTTNLTQNIPEEDKLGLLDNPPLWLYDGKWVLVPKHGDFEQIHSFIKCFIANKVCDDLLE